jgi:hypothetical protein
LWRYIGRADKLIAESCRTSRKKLLHRHLAQRRNLFAKAVSAGDYRTALAVAKDEAELQGLYPPKKVAPTNPKGDQEYGAGLSDAERLAALERLYAALGHRNGSPPANGQDGADGPLLGRPGAAAERGGAQPRPLADEAATIPCSQTILNCSRQSGKSTTAAALALRAALLEAGALVLLLSPTLRQSGELFRDKFKKLYNNLGRPVAARQESALTMELVNGSRIISLPGDEGTIRGYSGVSLLVLDEAARIVDDLYLSVRPMLAVSGGRLVALSTPWGKRGWFFEEWTGQAEWDRVEITADQCPRITAEFLGEERQALGERYFRQEYFCSFEDVIDAVFSECDIVATAVLEQTEHWPPGALFPEVMPRERHYAVRHLQRWPLGTSYPQIVADTVALFRRPPLPDSSLVLDATGVGRAVIDLFRQAVRDGMKAHVLPVTITGGERPHYAAGVWMVPKKELAGVLQVLLQRQRLKVAQLPERETLLKELRTFRVKVKVTTDNESFEAWRESDHDDLVFAVALPCWLGERAAAYPPPTLRVLPLNGRDVRKRLHLVVCSHEQLAEVTTDQQTVLLVSVQNPTSNGEPPVVPATGLRKLLGGLALSFADLTPEECRKTWGQPIPPYGKPAADVLMRQEDGKRLWYFLRRHRDPAPEVLVIADEGDRRALSLAYAICDVQGLPRGETIHVVAGEPEAKHTGAAPNPHVFTLAKSCRSLVV